MSCHQFLCEIGIRVSGVQQNSELICRKLFVFAAGSTAASNLDWTLQMTSAHSFPGRRTQLRVI